MYKNNAVILSDMQISDIKKLASDTRQFFGVHPVVPIGSDIRLLLEKKGILLCEYPYPDSEGTHTYGNITWFKTDDGTITFIGLNTSSYYDEQIFALAHEIYHYSTQTGKAYTPELDYEDEMVEKQADRFAAELLLPDEALKRTVKDAFAALDMYDVPENRLLRFAARIQCDWWLPYQSIINRFYEEKLILREQYDRLYDIDCRSEEGIYRRILRNTDKEISELLNKKTRSVGISNRVTEIIISNYEDGFIDDDEFLKLLKLFDKKPEDFGFDMSIELDDDLRDMKLSEDDE